MHGLVLSGVASESYQWISISQISHWSALKSNRSKVSYRHIRSEQTEQTVTCRCVLLFSGEGHWARECPDKGDKGRKGGGKSWDRDRDKGKGYGGGYGGGKRSLACYNQFKSLEDSWNRDCSEANCTVALLCSAKTCRDHLMLEVHCAYSLAKEEEGIMMIEAILKRCGCIEFIDVKFSCSKMGSKALSCSQRIFPNNDISGHLRMLSREPCQWILPIRSYAKANFLLWRRAAVRFPWLPTVLRNTTTPEGLLLLVE